MVKKINYGFHRPHKRVQFTGELLDHKTGELVRPPARTKQQFVAQCDINNIVKQFTRTGQFTHLAANAAKGTYTDLPDPIDFQDSMNLVIQAEQAFASLTAKVRNRFSNSPAEFLAFMADSANQEEAIKLGLAKDTRPPPAPPEGAGKPPQEPTGGDGGKPPSEGPKGP